MPSKRKKQRRIQHKKEENVLKVMKKPSFKKKPPIDYLANIRTMFIKLQNLTSSLHNNVKQYSNTFKEYIFSKSPFSISNSIKKYISASKPNLKSKFEVKSTKFFDLFVLYEKDLCTARTIFSEMWDKNTWKEAKNVEQQYQIKRRIIKHVLFVMSNLDMFLFRKLLLKNGDKFPGLCEVIDHRKQLLYFLIILMRKEKDVVNNLVEILQLWYLIQPVVRELFKYTKGKVTDVMEPILTDVDALYDCLISLKKNCPTKYFLPETINIYSNVYILDD